MLQKLKNLTEKFKNFRHSPVHEAPTALPHVNSDAPVATLASQTPETAAPHQTSNVFTDLFPKKKEATNDTLISSLNATNNSAGILKPNLSDSDVLIYKKPIIGARLLLLAILLLILSSIFFYTRLSPTFTFFGENPVQKRESVQTEMLASAGKVSALNYTLAKYALDDFLFSADAYFYKVDVYNSPLTSQKKKSELEAEFPVLRSRMREDLMLAYEKLSAHVLPADVSPLSVNSEDVKKATREVLRENISKSDSPEHTEFIRATMKLLDSSEIANTLGTYKIPAMTDEQFKAVVTTLGTGSSSAFGSLTLLREGRIHWTDIITEIEKVTKKVDPLFATKILDQKVGEIFYTSYNFDRKNNSLSIVGETISDDGSNFSISADLLDALNASKQFENATMNTFTKSLDGENSYKGVLSIDLTLESNKQ